MMYHRFLRIVANGELTCTSSAIWYIWYLIFQFWISHFIRENPFCKALHVLKQIDNTYWNQSFVRFDDKMSERGCMKHSKDQKIIMIIYTNHTQSF